MPEFLSAKEMARRLGTDPRNFRKFLRETTEADQHPGQGGRWTFLDDDDVVEEHRTNFETWRGAKAKRQAAEAPEDVEELEDDFEEIELDDEDEEDLEEI